MRRKLKERVQLRLMRSKRWSSMKRWARRRGLIPRWMVEDPGQYRWVVLARRSPRFCRWLYWLREKMDLVIYDRASTDTVWRTGAALAIVERFGFGEHLAAIATNPDIVSLQADTFTEEQWEELMTRVSETGGSLEAKARFRRMDVGLSPEPPDERS